MRAPLNDSELDERLRGMGLERDDSIAAPPPSKNRTVLCRSGRKRILVKVADGPGNVGVLREGSVLERISQLDQEPGSPLLIPGLHAFDPRSGLLALHWLNGAETLHHYHRRTQEYPRLVARQVGKALGYLHEMSRRMRTSNASCGCGPTSTPGSRGWASSSSPRSRPTAPR